MREMEEELRRALARVDAPDGFAGRVLARVSMQAQVRPWYLRYGPIAAMVALAVSGTLVYDRHVQQERTENAQKLAFALHLTAEKLAAINHRLKSSSPTVRVTETHEREQL